MRSTNRNVTRTAAVGCLLLACSTNQVLIAQGGKKPIAAPSQPKTPQDKKNAVPKHPDQKKTELDAISSRALARWAKLERNAGREGVKSIRFDVKLTSAGGMTGKWEATAKYRFERGAKDHNGVLRWDDSEVADAMTRRGWTAKAFSGEFDPQVATRDFAGCNLVGTSRRNGTILEVKGGGRTEETFLVFDKAGVLVAKMIGKMRKRLYYDVEKSAAGERFALSGETYSMPGAEGDTTITRKVIDGFSIPVKIREVVKVKGQILSDLTFVLENHKVNEKPAGKPKAKSPKK